MKMRFALLVGALFPVLGFAQSTCYKWHAGGLWFGISNQPPSGEYMDGATECAAVAAWRDQIYNGTPRDWTSETSVTSSPGAAGQGVTGSCGLQVVYTPATPAGTTYCNNNPSSCNPGESYSVALSSVQMLECPADCAEKANEEFLVQAIDMNDTFTPPTEGCFEGCSAFARARQLWGRIGPVNQRNWLTEYQYTGLECEEEPPIQGDEGDGEECIEGSELQYCRGPQTPDNCGYFNGEYVCVPSMGDDQCHVSTTGAMLCPEEASLPPKPDNGTPGEQATPDDELQMRDPETGDTINIEYYNSSTVNNSARPPGTGNNTDGSGYTGDGSGDSEGECEGEDCGEGSVSGGESCDAAPVCEGDALMCASIEQSWRNRCVESPTDEDMLAAFGPKEQEGGGWFGDDTEYALPESLESTGWIGGSCPSDIPINLGAQLGTVEIPISSWCEWMGLIGSLVMVSAYLGGLRIIIGGL